MLGKGRLVVEYQTYLLHSADNYMTFAFYLLAIIYRE